MLEVIFLIVFTIYNIEKFLLIPKWIKKMDQEQSTVEKIHYIRPLILLMILCYLVTFLFLNFNNYYGIVNYAYFGFLLMICFTVFVYNFLPTVFGESYVPGTITGSILNIPIALYIVFGKYGNEISFLKLFISFSVITIVVIIIDIAVKSIGLKEEKNIHNGINYKNTLIVEFPLRGEWIAPNTPAKMVPSHGTNELGQRYAYDFVQLEDKGRFYRANKLRYLLFGVPLNICYCWGKEIYAPCNGKIIESKDGYKERHRVHILTDILAIYKNSLTFNLKKKGFQPVVGNYIIMECDSNVYAFFAHFQKDSIAVSVGENVQKGQFLGKVGHSGNSTEPHLHFHLMDNSDLTRAKGISCAFEKYEVLQDGEWKTVRNSIPSDKDRIRFNK